jgi:hypothetical protein
MNSVLGSMIKFVGGAIVGNFIEWTFHKHVLHGLGKKKDSNWNFHWYKHHKTCRKNMIDPDYSLSWQSIAKTPEFITLSLASGLLLLTSPKQPFFIAGLVGYGVLYYAVHMRSHLDEQWAKKWIPWHVAHHQVGNQEHTFNVVFPLADHVLGTTMPVRQS